MANYHVMKKSDLGLWVVKREGASRISGASNTQAKAEKVAKRFSAKSGGGEVRIHKPTGQIRDSDTVAPGNDPTRRKDRKH